VGNFEDLPGWVSNLAGRQSYPQARIINICAKLNQPSRLKTTRQVGKVLHKIAELIPAIKIAGCVFKKRIPP